MDPDAERLLDARGPAVAEVGRRLCELILAAYPDAVISVDEDRIGFGSGPGYRGLRFTVAPYAAHVTFGVDHGASLPDPAGLLTGAGKVHKHVKLRTVADVEAPALADLIAARLAVGDR
jgi:hypothetical protein